MVVAIGTFWTPYPPWRYSLFIVNSTKCSDSFFTLSGQNNFFGFVKPEKVSSVLIKTWHFLAWISREPERLQLQPNGANLLVSFEIWIPPNIWNYILEQHVATIARIFWAGAFDDLSIASNNFSWTTCFQSSCIRYSIDIGMPVSQCIFSWSVTHSSSSGYFTFWFIFSMTQVALYFR